ncbi:MAG: thiamine pyrophosphate-binding protein [Dongiaceae bacterium]
MTTVGELIVETLAAHGIDRVFCVPGESYLGLLDALYGRRDVDTVVCRHESGAGFMALADARLTGRPGVACVSRGPGACNAAIAVHTAQQDGVPFLLLIGQVATCDVRRDSFQEIDYDAMFGSIAKWTAEITDPRRAAETLLRALQAATVGVPGPVVLAIPEDVLTAPCPVDVVRPQSAVAAAPAPGSLAELSRRLAAARRPLAISGSGIGRPGERERLLGFLEAWDLPSVVAFRCQDLLPNGHRLYAGDMGLSNPAAQMRLLEQADLLVVLGARLTDITTQGYSFPQLVRPAQALVHVHEDPAVIGTHFASDLSIACAPIALIDAIGRPDGVLPDRREWIDALAAERRRIAAVRTFDVDDGVPFELVVDRLGRHLASDAIVTLDAGTFAAPAYRVIEFRPPQRLLAPISGAMGFGIPAAVAAGLRAPGRQVVCLVGDGGLLMTGGELAVAIERRLPLKIIVSENRAYGSIRIHQERNYPGRSVGTSFANPDLGLIGRAYGFATTRIGTVAGLEGLPALLDAPDPQLVIVETSMAAVMPSRTA